jgi:Asp-tRNA(Asn)/Glu-tRNA(Gln) amidotransferase A subunit family amidase
VPLDGAVPLSFTLDSIGPLARSVACCAALDAVLANESFVPLQPRPIKGMRLAVPTTWRSTISTRRSRSIQAPWNAFTPGADRADQRRIPRCPG